MKIRESFGDRVFNRLNQLILSLIMLIILYPLWFIVISSVSDPNAVSLGEVLVWPVGFSLKGYQRILEYEPIWIGYRNSLFYTVFGTVINLAITFTCAYALSRRDLIGRQVVTALFTFTMFFSGGLIPTFLVVNQLGLVNTIWSLLIPNAVAMWNIILTRTYFQQNIPLELQESSQIDGATNTQLFCKIVLPLSTPIIAVMALFYGVGHWNSYFDALIYLSNRQILPLQIFLREVLLQNETVDFLTMAGDEMESMAERAAMAQIMKYGLIVVATLPVMVIYPIVQKYYVHGIMVGAIKG